MEWKREAPPPSCFFSEKELGVTCFFFEYVLFFLKPTKNEVRKYEQSYSPHRYPTHD